MQPRQSISRAQRPHRSPAAWLPLLAALAIAGLAIAWPARRLPGDERPAEYTCIRDVEYARPDDVPLAADVYVPRGKGPFPGVLMVHGGAWLAGSKGNMGRAARILAEKGYTVACINYRLAPKAKFPAQVEDCKEAVRWFRRHADRYKLDPDRLAGYGYSAGGHLVCMLGVTDPEDGLEGSGKREDSPSTRLQAVVAGGAPCDFTWVPLDDRWLAYFLGGTRREKPDVYRRASPGTFVSKDDPPTLFFHGELDYMVPRKLPRSLYKRLQEAGVPAEFELIADKGHIGTFLADEPVETAARFLDRHLKGASAEADGNPAGGPEVPVKPSRQDRRSEGQEGLQGRAEEQQERQEAHGEGSA